MRDRLFFIKRTYNNFNNNNCRGFIMMNKISLGLSISSFVLILIMFVLGNINLNFNEDESVVVGQAKYDYCNPIHDYYDKDWVDRYSKWSYQAKVFSCSEFFSINNYIEHEIYLHSNERGSVTGEGIHHQHYDEY